MVLDVARRHHGYSRDLDFAYVTEVFDICDSMGPFFKYPGIIEWTRWILVLQMKLVLLEIYVL